MNCGPAEAGLGILAGWRPEPGNPAPPYEQLRQRIALMAAEGVLPVGARLPPVSVLAQLTGLAPNTVARSFQELERAGVLRTAGRRGTFVATDGDTARATVARAAADFVAVVQGQGMAAEEALRIVIAVLPGIRPGPSNAGSPGAGS